MRSGLDVCVCFVCLYVLACMFVCLRVCLCLSNKRLHIKILMSLGFDIHGVSIPE